MTTRDSTVPRRLVVLGAIAMALIALVGCGGSSSSTTAATNSAPSSTSSQAPATTSTTGTTTTTAGLTHEQFAAKLDDICKRGNASQASLEKQYDTAVNANDYAKAASLFEEANRQFQPFEAEVEKLTPPASDRATFERYLTANNRLQGIRERLVPALKARDLEQVQQLVDIGNSQTKTRTEAAIDLGTKNCGS